MVWRWAWGAVVDVVACDGSAERKDCAIKFGQSYFREILQTTTALFSFLQIHLFPGYPSNMTCRFIFAGDGCG
jgi:hypothetical protein